jgi:hypothetical protein
MLNRSAVVVRPRQPFLDWVRAVDYDDAPDVTMDDMRATIYLVPEYEDSDGAERFLKRAYDEIFCRQLNGWYTEESLWPKDRSWRVFKAWFDIEHIDVIEDLVDAALEDE